MAAQDLTVSLPVELVEKVNAYVAERGTTVDALVCESLEEKLSGDDRSRLAAEWLIERAKRGPYFTIDPRSISRDELHERR
jgi:hypothetical protein